jgi:hypothetical protein
MPRFILSILLIFVLQQASVAQVVYSIETVEGRHGHDAYLVLNNYLSIAVDGMFCRDFILASDEVELSPEPQKTCTYIIRPMKLGLTQINILRKDSSLIDSIQLRVLPMPFKMVIDRAVEDDCGFISASSSAIYQGMTLQSVNMNVSAFARIVSFELELHRAGVSVQKQVVTAYNRDSHKALFDVLPDLQKGDLLYLTKLKYSYTGVILDYSNDIKISVQ